MTPWILLGVAVLLAAASLKMWLDFGQRQLRAEMQRLRRLVDSNTQRMAAIRDRTSDLGIENKALIARREELHARVLLELTLFFCWGVYGRLCSDQGLHNQSSGAVATGCGALDREGDPLATGS
jgi:hypothetical protein